MENRKFNENRENSIAKLPIFSNLTKSQKLSVLNSQLKKSFPFFDFRFPLVKFLLSS